MRLQFKLLQSLGFALTLSGAAMAHPTAGAGDGGQQVSVSVADLRLDTAAGRRVAHARLQRAAEQVCGPAPSHPADLEHVAAFETCRRTALHDAEQRLSEAAAAQQASVAFGIARR